MDQASGRRESSLQLSLFRLYAETQKYRCTELPRGKGIQLSRESSALILPGLRLFNFTFEVRRPGEGDQQPHQQRRCDGKHSLIEESDRYETKNQMRTPPEPDVLMKDV